MDQDHRTQQEFFEEFIGPITAGQKVRERYIARKNFSVRLSAEHTVFVCIAIILSVVVFFSLGVERGKRLAQTATAVVDSPEEPTLPVPEKSPAQASEVVAEDSSVRYTVQIVTYKKESTAADKIAALQREGLSAFIIPKDDLFQVCVGRYRTAHDAGQALRGLRARYKDCFVRNTQ